ncbi:MAG: hypothetical protein DDG60_14330 [Anaerolineae bacterium]|nr:MAG: hypothetical protein DDG60_14330 [Anaerolineae bacterium]
MTILKDILGKIPYSADLYTALRPVRPRTRYNLTQLETILPSAVEQVRNQLGKQPATPKKIVLFATLHYWVEQAVIIGLALRGLGHEVTIAYLPYGDWDKPIHPFDLRRQDLYTRRVLRPLHGLVHSLSLLELPAVGHLPLPLEAAIETASAFDTMYTLQVEDFDRNSALYRLRLTRNRQAALAALHFLQNSRPDAVLIPNGLVTELGVFYQVARHLGLPTTTYEFNDQREQIWLAQNEIVMRQNTDALWAAKGTLPLTQAEREKIAALEDARTSAKKYGKGTRFWQDVPSQGGEKLRADLGLDARPIVLLATNVLGDSLTLGRNIFTASMAEWIEKTVQYLAQRPQAQLVVRIHPGERLMKGPSMVSVIERALPERPEHIHVIGPHEKVNTYDLMEIAALGLAYTTTVGMEMAMRSVPVIVAGQTHYRGRGFTYDPSTYTEYFEMLNTLLAASPPMRLTETQVEIAWNYAYRFFFDFPFDFPWRLMHFWKDYQTWPLARVLSEEGRTAFGKTFDYLTGTPIEY